MVPLWERHGSHRGRLVSEEIFRATAARVRQATWRSNERSLLSDTRAGAHPWLCARCQRTMREPRHRFPAPRF
ncbi:hypothetical protein AAFF_G00396290 [Aldrovandia affinis]|uniref:Uncharacterized protein n=1 Tax=Aldrovandia affinis TaxID=143900 RepID=A0AAD7SDD6_9TELE|nr:hypothetical protein AAFF_G00396290 [Aldrovandia affinis]